MEGTKKTTCPSQSLHSHNGKGWKGGDGFASELRNSRSIWSCQLDIVPDSNAPSGFSEAIDSNLLPLKSNSIIQRNI